MLHNLPNNDAWISRFKDFKSWVDAHGGKMPEEDLNGGPEDTLHSWLKRQRAGRADGSLANSLDAILDTVKGAFTEPAPTVQERLERAKELGSENDGAEVPASRSRIDRLEAFYEQHDRLPSFGGTAPDEQNLYKHLNSVIRVRYRRGELDPLLEARLSRIPGVFAGRIYRQRAAKEAQKTAQSEKARARAARMEDLIRFCSEEGRLPRTLGAAPEPALYDYLRRRVRPAYAAGQLDEVTTKRLMALPGVLTRKTPRTATRRKAA